MIEIAPYAQKVSDLAGRVLSRFFGSRNERLIRGMRPIVDRIATFEDDFKKSTDQQLKDKTPALKAELEAGKSLDDILPEAFALVREVAQRTLGMRHFDVQMMGGILLHRGTVIEMMTGEGKTLVATCPAYLNALAGRGVHVITVNDYLASRDSTWMGEIYRFLGLTVGCIQSRMEDPKEKRSHYQCDITYGTGNEFGFDYLRDNMKSDIEEIVQGNLNYAIIDEVDSILIDEARTPLIISGAADEGDEKYLICNRLATRLKKDTDFKIDEKETSISLTEEGIARCEELLGVDHLYAGKNADLPHFINNALRAHYLQKKDRDYVTQGGDVVIVDEHTGRLMTGRRWSDGLHQAVEVKEGLPIKRESQTLASITFQNLFKLYSKMSGMTGTAMTEAGEFHKIYHLDVVAVPPNRPCKRQDHPDLVFGTKKEKLDAIITEIAACHKRGQPILVGTASIESSEEISSHLSRSGVPHEVLNAKNHAREALIIAQAGRKRAVTVATNMAGRGTDIVLGGNSDILARSEAGPEASEEEIQKIVATLKPKLDHEHHEVLELGGLYVLGTERHESRRIDNQLRGRSARQGDPGTSRFYLSLEDDLMRRFAPPWATRIMQKSGLRDGEPIEHSLISKSISNAQRKVEEFNFEIRKNLLEYDEVMNEQRKYIYKLRYRVLREEGLFDMLCDWVQNAIADRVEQLHTDLRLEEDSSASKTKFKEWVQQCFGQKLDENISLPDLERRDLENMVYTLFKDVYAKKENEISSRTCRMIEGFVLRQTIDQYWKEHLYNMDHVKDSIGWRGYAQVDPKVEYKREAYRLFADMLVQMKQQVTNLAIRLSLSRPEDVEARSVYQEDRAIHREADSLVGQPSPGQPPPREEIEITRPIVNNENRVGRNEPCPCGSGKKYKQCCSKTI